MTAVARLTGLEPATPGVTGRYSNQLSYNRAAAVEGVIWPPCDGVKHENREKFIASDESCGKPLVCGSRAG